VLNFPLLFGLRFPKVHGDRLVVSITVGMPYNVGKRLIDRAGDGPAVLRFEFQSLCQTFHGCPYYRETFGIAIQRDHQQQTSSVARL